MLTVEYRINGQLVGVTNIINIADIALFGDGKLCRYEYEHFAFENKVVLRGKVKHLRKEGFEKLVKKVMRQIGEKQ